VALQDNSRAQANGEPRKFLDNAMELHDKALGASNKPIAPWVDFLRLLSD
jgi:hypothetical protein